MQHTDSIRNAHYEFLDICKIDAWRWPLTTDVNVLNLGNMMQRRVLLGSVAWLSLAGAGAPAVNGQYLLSAETTVHAESTVGTYDRSLHAELSASVQSSGSQVSLEVRRDNHVCVLRGALAGNIATFVQGQQCPQSIRGEGFQADLAGTLTFGSATLGAHELTLTTKWDVRGTVKLGPISIPVTGTVSTVAAGPKS